MPSSLTFGTRLIVAAATAAIFACNAYDPAADEMGIYRSAGTDVQGTDVQGTDVQGTDVQGTDVQGIDLSGNKFDGRGMYFHSQKYAGATLNGKPVCLGLYQGALYAVPGSQCSDKYPPGPKTYGAITGPGLKGLEVYADEFLPDGTMGKTNFKYRVTGVSDEYWTLPKAFTNGSYSPGTTQLYQLEVEFKGGFVQACGKDQDGRSHAIPTHGRWNSTGAKVATSSYFTFGCTNAVIAKCYRWGYRPWINAEFWDNHQSCVRMARADYCGDGYSWTKTGTTINHWDRLAPPVQTIATEPEYNDEGGFMFEAGWDKTGARCVAHFRWYNLPEGFPADRCTHQIRGPKWTPGPDGCQSKDPRDCKPTICDKEAEAVFTWPEIDHLNKSLCNGRGPSGECLKG